MLHATRSANALSPNVRHMTQPLHIPQLGTTDTELYRRIDEVVHYLWDPLCVSEFPGARDEYYSYLPKIFELVKSERDDELFTYLKRIAYLEMGLTFLDEEKTRNAIDVLMVWKSELEDYA